MKKYLIFVGIGMLSLGLITQMNISGNNSESMLKEKNYSQIEDFVVKESEGTVFLSVKAGAGIPNTSKEFEKIDIVSFGYAWLMPYENDNLLGVFSNFHTIDGFIGPWHSEQIRLVPKDDSFCLISEPILAEISASENQVRTLLSIHYLHFDPHEIDRAASVILIENHSCDSGFEAKILKSIPSL